MRYLYRILAGVLIITLALPVLAGCRRYNGEPTTVNGFKLNTFVSITVYEQVDTEILDQCLALCDKYEMLFSRTLKDSTLSQVNNQTLKEIPEELAHLINKALEYSKLSNGSFDITIGAATQLWDFTAANPIVPDEDRIKASLEYIDYRQVQLTGNTISIPEGYCLDLGAIAKGYIADRMKDYLVEHGVKSAIINLGGNILCVGRNSNGNNFKIGVKKPFSQTGETLETLSIDHMSVVSSGTYERYFEADGRTYHHILNPKTGYPYDNNLIAVTIISKSSVDGDALSTVCFSLGLTKGMELINSLDNTEAIFVTNDNTVHYSDGCKNYLR